MTELMAAWIECAKKTTSSEVALRWAQAIQRLANAQKVLSSLPQVTHVQAPPT